MITSGFSLAFNNKTLLNGSNEMFWQRNIYQVTTSTNGNGTMTAYPMSGFSGTNVTLSNTPNANYNFAGYSVTGATLTGDQFTLNNDVTAKANFNNYELIYSSNAETAGTAIYHNFNVSVPSGYPYVAARFDVKDGGGIILDYTTRQFTGPYSFTRASMGNRDFTPVCNMDWDADESTALNQNYAITANTKVGAATAKNCLARNALRTEYNTINYVWAYNGAGFSAGVNGIWRYRDTRSNTFGSISDYSWTQTNRYGDDAVQLYTKNLRIGLFNSITDALSTTW